MLCNTKTRDRLHLCSKNEDNSSRSTSIYQREKGMDAAMFLTRVVPRRHEFSYCQAVTRGKNAIVGVAPRDAITGGIRGTQGLMPAIPTRAADTPCLCTKTTPLSPRWKEARLKFQPDTRGPPPPFQKASVSAKCVYVSGPSVVGSIDRWNDHRITRACSVSKCFLNEIDATNGRKYSA